MLKLGIVELKNLSCSASLVPREERVLSPQCS